MKTTKRCPKCNSQEIIHIPGEIKIGGVGSNIKINAFSAVKVSRYLCCDCGFCEEWVNAEGLSKLKKKYQ